MRFLKWFKKQNWGIKVGYVSLLIGFIVLLLGLILIGTATFTARDPNTVTPNLVGNGFSVMSQNGGPSNFLTAQGYGDLQRLYQSNDFTSAPLLQLLFGIIFLVILLPIFSGIAVLALAGGYFKRWLYT